MPGPSADGNPGVHSMELFGTWLSTLSHGISEDLMSVGADIGVGSVEAVPALVAADLGVLEIAERGVNGVRALGESSNLADRIVESTGVVPARRRLHDVF